MRRRGHDRSFATVEADDSAAPYQPAGAAGSARWLRGENTTGPPRPDGRALPEAANDPAKLPFTCGNLQITLGDVPAAEAPPGVREPWRIDGRLGVDVAFAVRVVIDAPNRRVEFRAE